MCRALRPQAGRRRCVARRGHQRAPATPEWHADSIGTQLLIDAAERECAAKVGRAQEKLVDVATAKDAALADMQQQLERMRVQRRVESRMTHAAVKSAEEAQKAAEAKCKEMQERLDALQISIEAEATCADASEKTTEVAAPATMHQLRIRLVCLDDDCSES